MSVLGFFIIFTLNYYRNFIFMLRVIAYLNVERETGDTMLLDFCF